jgi:hypothetical protein
MEFASLQAVVRMMSGELMLGPDLVHFQKIHGKSWGISSGMSSLFGG